MVGQIPRVPLPMSLGVPGRACGVYGTVQEGAALSDSEMEGMEEGPGIGAVSGTVGT